MKSKISFLGPRGTFTEEALDKYLGEQKKETVQKIPLPTIVEVIKSVDRGESDEGVVPIENSIEGPVNITQDVLTFESEAKIVREITIPIKHSLIGKENIKLNQIEKIISHPHATAQCRNFIENHFKDIEIVAANSTAEAIKIIKEAGENYAAIGTRVAADIYGLKIIESDIEDNKENQTRFVFIGSKISARTGADKTSIVCFLKKDRPGSLFNILKEFADRNINLTRLESRPAKKNLGDYVFMIDLDGHLHDKEIFEAIEILRQKVYLIKILGSYPKFRN